MPRQLVATKAGFYRGDYIAPGQTFTFFGEKNPKWAAEKGAPAPVVAQRADTKPPAAAKASKAKSTALTAASIGAADEV